ncbi:MAG: hypothetical protein QOI74_982 [Micromonosporaceae bacterium]|nr:hypothetical protein [Micromonosporaceae bacterium]
MRLLVLGGTAFVGRTVVRLAVAAGHEVTCAARGVTGAPEAGATFRYVDRDRPDGLDVLDGLEFDALVDVSSRPSHVRRAVAALAPRIGHAVYVSSASVYTDNGTPGQGVTGVAVYAPATSEQDDPSGNDRGNYGPCKVACEQAAIGAFGPDRVAVCRAGLIIGPFDTTNRFGYWVSRLVRGGEVLAPGTPADRVQYVDVRDLAAWLIDLADAGVAGTFNGAGTPVSFEHFLHRVAAGVGRDGPELTWVDQEFLLAWGVRPWAGVRSLPLWLPLPAYAGFLTRDVAASLATGMRTRDVADTARDTLTWLADRPTAPGDGDGLRAADEAAILAAWHTRTG